MRNRNDCLIVGLPGPTHYFGGLSLGNKASEQSRGEVSFPRAAALQSLELIEQFMELGHAVIVQPPHPRPINEEYSSSFMWAANMATVSSSKGTNDNRVHITPASLLSFKHRSIEPNYSQIFLKHVFSNSSFFKVHPPSVYADEGAANHAEFENGKHVFVYNFLAKKQGEGSGLAPDFSDVVLRQSREAFEHIAESHNLEPNNLLFLQQHMHSVAKGVFHNDVCFISGPDCVLCHRDSFENTGDIEQLGSAMGLEASAIRIVEPEDLSIEEAVKSYIFNSTFSKQPDGTYVMLAPQASKHCARTKLVIDSLIASSFPVKRVVFVPLDQSMKNGGGPACLRLRVPLTDTEFKAIEPTRFATKLMLKELKQTVQELYPKTFDIESGTDFLSHKPIYDTLGTVLQCSEIYKLWESLKP